MQVIQARNVNDAVVKGAALLSAAGVRQDSRAGGTLEYPEPVCTVYERPLERVLYDGVRDANPFFHLMEALWMLAGRQDVEWLARFNKRMATYSDDGKIFNAAYGYRWRNQFKLKTGDTDQLSAIVKILRGDPDSRRAVLQIWDAEDDLAAPSKDLACNTQAAFKVRAGRLNMMVSNRSNDVVWGCYGANAVQFSMLLEYMAARIGVAPGVYRQVSDSFHAYHDTWDKISGAAERFYDPYVTGEVAPYPLVAEAESFDAELYRWIDLAASPQAKDPGGWRNAFFPDVATPLAQAWFAYKAKDHIGAIAWTERCQASDWRRASLEWLDRRARAAEAA